MQSLILNDQGASILRQTAEVAEIRDSAGNLLGFFTPVGRQIEEPRRRFTKEEIEARCSKPGMPLIEVFRRMLPLAPDEKSRADLEARIQQMAAEKECDTP